MRKMSVQLATTSSTGRGLLWSGIGLAILAIVLGIIQYVLQILVVPWQVPIVTTLGALLLLVSVTRRFTLTRVIAVVLITALAGLEWVFMASLSKLPEYTGPVRAGLKIPAFQTALADGRPFTDQNLQDGTPSVLIFFRGRW
jgi:hypothetical protein